MANQHSPFEYEKYYHVFNRGNNKENLFKNEGNYLYFLGKWKKYVQPYADTLAYCLMPNHFHFLIKIKNEPEPTSILSSSQQSTKPSGISRVDHQVDINTLLEDQFRNLFSAYTLAFNKQQSRTGSLFQKRFKRIEINSDLYLTRIIHYIHNNPIHHHFAKDYSEWKFSSYNTVLVNLLLPCKGRMLLTGLVGLMNLKNFTVIKSVIKILNSL